MKASEALKIYEESNGLLIDSLDNAYKELKKEALLGSRKAWVLIPSEAILEKFKSKLVEDGYTIGNRQANLLLVSF